MDKLIDALCLQCGMCCNGVLFADVRPEPGDASPLFKARPFARRATVSRLQRRHLRLRHLCRTSGALPEI